jgi:hypothetical protein
MKQGRLFDTFGGNVGDEFHADGKTYDPTKDRKRLKGQMHLVYQLMADGAWHTSTQLAKLIGCTDSAASARIRDLRKERFGNHIVQARRKVGGADGSWEYRVAPKAEYRQRARLQTETYGKLYAFCSKCGLPMAPAEKGPTADNPGYVGFEPCCGTASVRFTE